MDDSASIVPLRTAPSRSVPHPIACHRTLRGCRIIGRSVQLGRLGSRPYVYLRAYISLRLVSDLLSRVSNAFSPTLCRFETHSLTLNLLLPPSLPPWKPRSCFSPAQQFVSMSRTFQTLRKPLDRRRGGPRMSCRSVGGLRERIGDVFERIVRVSKNR
ncbi:uncharacterized protein YALI1_D26934g [Yarrowia lipolytica]|uniref:Uncharacterized protein n=1 Tax=Yarrowia lipolytica TaxID=4952 RepID=A0A1D8NFK2_YARLL|nr:hypothetical protein YALI1_D26934g [Yarrowia lipolytica]